MARHRQTEPVPPEPRWLTKKPSDGWLTCQHCRGDIETGEAVYFVPSGLPGHGWHYCHRPACGVNIASQIKAGATVSIRRTT